MGNVLPVISTHFIYLKLKNSLRQTTHAFIGDMIEQGYGHIVGVSSMISYFPMGGTISYTTSKYAVRGFMDALNRKCRHENWGIRTFTVLPHLTNTRKELVDFLRQKIPYVCRNTKFALSLVSLSFTYFQFQEQ